jgi:hypothetical protein
MRWRLLLSLIIFLGGCATITKGTTQSIAVNTPGVVGATCTLSSSTIGSRTVVTPATLTVDKGQEGIVVRCAKECYQEGAGIIASNIEAMTAGNVIAGGVIGLGVDAVSGAMNKYVSETSVTMVPIQGCRARHASSHAGQMSRPPRLG